MKGDGRVSHTVLLEWEWEWDLSWLKDIFQVFDQFAIFIMVWRKEKGCCLPNWMMRDVMAEGGIISKSIKGIFQRVRETIDEVLGYDWAQNTALGHSSLNGEKRWKDSVESHMLVRRVEEVSNPRVELALHAMSLEINVGRWTLLTAQDMSKESALISCLTLRASIHCWESWSSMSKVEWPGLNLNWWSEIRPSEKRKDFTSTVWPCWGFKVS